MDPSRVVMTRLFDALVDAVMPYSDSRLNVRLETKWSHGDERSWRIRVWAEHGGLNQEELEEILKLLKAEEDTHEGCTLDCMIQNNAIEISFA